MAIQNLKVQVSVDIASAISKLEDLQEELQDVAERIEQVDAVGTDGIRVTTNVESINDELTALSARIKSWELRNGIDIDVDVHHDDFLQELRGAEIPVSAVLDDAPSVSGGPDDDTVMNIQPRQFRGIMRDAVADGVRSVTVDAGGERGIDISPDFGGAEQGAQRAIDGVDSVTIDEADSEHVRQFKLGESMDQFRADNMRELFGTMGFRDRRDRRSPMLTMLKDVGDEFGDLIATVQDFDLRMSDVHNAFARLIPLLFVFIGTLPAAITALVGLATAAAAAGAALLAIAGLGALGLALEDGQFDMDNLTEAFNEVRDDFIEAFEPLAERLQPLFEDGLDGLQTLFQTMARQGDALMQLTDEARAFGGFILDITPTVLRSVAAMAETFSAVFGDIATFVEENFASAMRMLARITLEALPAFSQLVQLLVGALPALIEFSIGMMQVANVILVVVSTLFRLLSLVGIGPRLFGILLGSILAVASAVLFANTALMGLIFRGLIGVFKWLIAVQAQNLSTSASFWTLARSAGAARVALAALGAVAGGLILGGALGALSGMISGFLGVNDSATKAKDALKDFDRVANRMGGPDDLYSGPVPTEETGGSGAAASITSVTNNVNLETTGDPQQDASNTSAAFFRAGRTSGGTR